jgi:REP element-mobilizing transposase RayT
MTEKFQNKYRSESARLAGYDYTRAGLYFITICTKNRECYFGEIISEKIKLSNIGVLADVFWHEIKNHTKNIELHSFVVMPNHIHGILEILDENETMNHGGNDGIRRDGACRDDACIVPTKNEQMAAISPKSGSVSRIIGAYKSAVSKHAHRLGYEFNWQPRFHDHIIRNENEYLRIATYIENNTKNWKNDKFNDE